VACGAQEAQRQARALAQGCPTPCSWLVAEARLACAEPGLCVCPEQATLLSDGTYGLQANIFRARGYCLVLSQHTICVQYQYSVLAQSRNADCMLISGPVLLLKALKFPGNFPQEKEILSFRTSAPQVCTPHLNRGARACST